MCKIMDNRINIVVMSGKKMIKYGQRIVIDDDFDGSFSLILNKINVKWSLEKKKQQSWMTIFRQIKIPNCDIHVLSDYELYIAYIYQITNAQLSDNGLSSPIKIEGENDIIKYKITFSFNPTDIYDTLNQIKRLQRKNRKPGKKVHYENHYEVTNPKPYQGGTFSGK